MKLGSIPLYIALAALHSSIRDVNASNCSAFPACAALNLTGLCCPTNDTVTLDCCGESAQCKYHSICSALNLTGYCCPTVENTTLDCCSGITPAAPETAKPSTPAPTFSPTLAPSFSTPPPVLTAQVSTPAPTFSPTAAPTLSPTAAPITPIPVLVSITPIDPSFQGFCMEDNTENNRVTLSYCDATKLEQKFKYDGKLIRTGSNESMCLQASYNPPAMSGEWVRVLPCNSTNPVQKFTWNVSSNGEISLTDYPTICLTFREGLIYSKKDYVSYIKLASCVNDWGFTLGWKAKGFA